MTVGTKQPVLCFVFNYINGLILWNSSLALLCTLWLDGNLTCCVQSPVWTAYITGGFNFAVESMIINKSKKKITSCNEPSFVVVVYFWTLKKNYLWCLIMLLFICQFCLTCTHRVALNKLFPVTSVRCVVSSFKQILWQLLSSESVGK